jgi:hypothetical protein
LQEWLSAARSPPIRTLARTLNDPNMIRRAILLGLALSAQATWS